VSEPTPIALLVEDERQIRRFVRNTLELEGWSVFEAETVKQGLVEAGTRHPELVILDLGLPDRDGVDFIRELRAWSEIPVIVLSARIGEHDKIEALDAGADDYLTKPFGVGELLARIRAAQRRRLLAKGDGKPKFRFGEIEVDLAARTVKKRGEAIHLTPIEYRLLTLLVANAGKVLTYRYICREVWGRTQEQSYHYARIYMGHLRQKLEDDPTQPQYIITETGVGYRLNVHESSVAAPHRG
jgi:two-component system, OmpR family, KDP operon response regulator KdpE